MALSRRATLAAPLLLPALARAQGAWPERPIRIIVPFPPGQAADIVTRLIADELSRRWPQRVVVENRGGGAGAPAMEAGARAAPDGYTLTAGSSGTLGVNPSVLPNPPYDAERDFAAVTNLAIVPLLIISHPNFRAQDIEHAVISAREHPGLVDIASAGPATSQHMAIELFMARLGLRMNVVHYRGSGPAITDLVAGNIPLMMDSVASALPHIRGGRAKALAVTTPSRVPQLPETPSIGESVSPGYEAFGWSGLVAPTGTPPEVVAKINREVVDILAQPHIVARMEQLALVPDPGTPADFGAFIKAEIAKWREVARIANVRLEG